VLEASSASPNQQHDLPEPTTPEEVVDDESAALQMLRGVCA
jgi:hypothetical protein